MEDDRQKAEIRNTALFFWKAAVTTPFLLSMT